ncbi:MAG: histidine kinase dimerization/phospho-acceptor domain-containing protein [Pseudomonadota bacterium]
MNTDCIAADADTRTPAAHAPAPELVERLRTSLTALRSSAELLRDHPQMAEDDRTQFVEIVLAEERRLEKLLASTFEG